VEKLRQFLLGRVSPMKGRHHTEETKLKFKNRKLSSEHKEKLRQAGLGRKNV
jgi:NUMOD3 motif.